jgi:NHLM bacteriocin system ABC transporter ATP-binding protein
MSETRLRDASPIDTGLESPTHPPSVPPDDPSDALLAACRLVAAELGIEVRRPPRAAAEDPIVDPLAAIARASGVRLRRVALDGEWWRDDGGPLLAFRAGGGAPVALLWTRARRYRLVDTATGARMLVTPRVASTLAPQAYAFYRPFPLGPISGADLIRFGFRGSRRDALTVLVAGALGGFVGIATPLATGLLIDRFIPQGDRAGLVRLALALTAGAFAVAAFTVTRGVATLRIETRADGAIQAAIWDRLLGLPVAFFRGYTVGDLTLRAMGIDIARSALTNVAVAAVLAFAFTAWSLGLLFVIDPALAMVATLLITVLVVATALIGRALRRHSQVVQERSGTLAGTVRQLLLGLPKLRVAGAERRAFAVWGRDFAAHRETTRRAQQTAIWISVLAAAAPPAAAAVVFALVGQRAAGNLSTGEFLAFIAAFGQVLAAALGLGTAFETAARLVPTYERARPILETFPEVDPVRADPGRMTGAIEVHDLTFAYVPGDPPVVSGVSFRIEPGQFVAIVGPSGAGKSTLFRLLLGFETPDLGAVLYDGRDLASLDMPAVRRQLGVVLQDDALLPGELGTNILGSSLLTLDDAWEATRLAGLDDDIRRMPMGMHTFVAEGGAMLSAGQRQRVMIARALVRRPRILLLDEATSALDERTQRIVAASLERLHATRIVIAHRLSTIAGADLILVMVDGRVVQRGTYAELLAQDGPFADLARRQIA